MQQSKHTFHNNKKINVGCDALDERKKVYGKTKPAAHNLI